MAQLNIQEEIFKSIETIVQKILDKSSVTLTIPSNIVDARPNGKYVVSIKGTNYLVYDGIGLSDLHTSSSVWVTVPNGDYKQAFISAKRK